MPARTDRQLGLSKEIQLDAQEMVRRAERGVGVAIRKGQDEGTIRTRADGGAPSHRSVLNGDTTEYKPGPTAFAAPHELTGQAGQNNGIYGLTDGVTDEHFEEAVAEAKSEGNLSLGQRRSGKTLCSAGSVR